MYECFHCGHRSVVWDSDFTFEDFGYEGEGIIHICHFEYYIPLGDSDDVDDDKEIE